MANADETKTVTSNNGTTETTDDKPVEKQELTKDVEAKIVRQIEYYFGDINLPRDKFLQEQIVLDDGWVPLSVLLTFKRLSALCSDAATIAAVMDKSDSTLIEVSNCKTKLRRNPEQPVPEYNEERRKELTARTAYAKGFALDETLESVMKFFETYGPYEAVHMRMYKDKALNKNMFKGSVFVIFKDVETCKKFLDLEEVKYNDKPLIRKWQADYFEEKKQERDDKNSRKAKKQQSEENKKAHTFPKGAILHMTGFKEDTVRETIKKEISEIYGKDAAYITFDKGDTEGYVRFGEESGAIEFVKKLTDSKMKIDETEITVRALEGDEEEKFLTNLSATLSKMRNQNKHFGKGKNRKRKGPGDSGPRAKHGRN